MKLRAAYLTLHRRTGAALARFGLTADQFVLLTVLAEGDALTQKDLVRRSASDPNTLSEMLARLERRGLVVRERHATDGRARTVALTPEGRQMQKRLWHASDPLRQILQQLYSPEALDTMVENLDRIHRAMAAVDDLAEPAGASPPDAQTLRDIKPS
jgi:DNA-binding MarR family transcriptional regulator